MQPRKAMKYDWRGKANEEGEEEIEKVKEGAGHISGPPYDYFVKWHVGL